MHERSRAITVGVSRATRGWDALEWAASEAYARNCSLRIVHVVSWSPFSLSSCGALPTDPIAHALAAGAALLGEAEKRAGRVAPGVPIATVLELGDPASAVLRVGAEGALIVLGREHRRRWRLPRVRSTVARVTRGASGPVAVIRLRGEAAGAREARAVALVDGGAADSAVLDVAFGAARRRGIGVTVVRASDAPEDAIREESIDRTLAECRAGFRDVPVVEQTVSHPLAAALLTHAGGAALLAVGPGLRRAALASLLSPPIGTDIGPLILVAPARIARSLGPSARVDPAGRA